MFVKGTDNALLNLTTAASSKLRGGWQTGQLLKAMVISTDRQGSAMLEINGQRLQAQPQNQTNMPLKTGQNLQLEVIRSGDSPLLKVLNPPANQQEVVTRGVRQSLPQQQPLPQLLNALNQLAQASKGETAQQLKTLSQQILNQLPQLQQLKTGPGVKQAIQDSGNFLEAKLKQMTQQGETGKGSANLNQDLKAGVLRLLQLLRSMPQTQPATGAARGNPAGNTTQASTAQQQTLTPSLSNPGGTTAAKGTAAASTAPPASSLSASQANSQTPTSTRVSPDISSKALAYSNNQPTPSQTQGATQGAATALMAARAGGETQQQLESGLARIQFNQLQSIQQSDGQQRPSWLLELPIRQADGQINTLQLEIQRDREEDEKSQRSAIWTISLSFELQTLGAIRAGLTLVGDNQIGVSLWANKSSTVELFEQHKATLQQGMEDAGLMVSRVGCQHGMPSKSKAETVFADQGLVDEQA
ncbi:MAG: flagellar hook-length control protein FliK [Gammaproteobacteria bacterium]|nr:flagellar hook-length control protein FliK [Gammaproteobacteria bacterium]